MRERVLRRRRDALFRELHRAGGFAAELGVEFGRRVLDLDLRPRERAEIVIDGDGAALEQDVEPQRRGEGAMVGGIARLGGDGLPQQPQRLVVIEVVGEIPGALAQLGGGLGW